eukprot:8419945-Pyramimonas_sp.AAC.1
MSSIPLRRTPTSASVDGPQSLPVPPQSRCARLPCPMRATPPLSTRTSQATRTLRSQPRAWGLIGVSRGWWRK